MGNTPDEDYDPLSVTRSFRLTESEDAALRRRALELDRPDAWVLRKALRAYLADTSTTRRSQHG